MYIIHLGFSGFPMDGSAAISRVKLTFKGLMQLGFYTLVINKESVGAATYRNKLNRSNGIPFIFTSSRSFRPASFFLRILNRVSGYFGEFILLAKKRKKIQAAILYTSSFWELVYYRIVSRLLSFKLVIQYVELRSSFDVEISFLEKTNNRFFDKYFFRFCDGVIAISDFLVKHVESKSKKLPLIKLPAVCDFNEFSLADPYKSEPYLMFCGNIVYGDVVEFIIDVFISLKREKVYDGSLILVISGSQETNWKNLREKISNPEIKGLVILKSHIPYSELLSLYKGADILMIPLRNTLQDTARFPHKIGEYTASKRPILSTKLGEPEIYFQDGISAILTEEYTRESYVEKLSGIFTSKTDLDKIGCEGYKIGLNNFNYPAQAMALKKFILDL